MVINTLERIMETLKEDTKSLDSYPELEIKENERLIKEFKWEYDSLKIKIIESGTQLADRTYVLPREDKIYIYWGTCCGGCSGLSEIEQFLSQYNVNSNLKDKEVIVVGRVAETSGLSYRFLTPQNSGCHNGKVMKYLAEYVEKNEGKMKISHELLLDHLMGEKFVIQNGGK